MKKGHIAWNKGKPQTEQVKQKISISKTGCTAWNKGKTNCFKHTQEWKDNMSKKMLGRKFSKESIEKMIKSKTGKHRKFKNPRNNKTKIDKLIRSLFEYKQWRSQCFERDKWTCQTCGARGIYVTVHHIKSLHKIIVDNEINNIQGAAKCQELWDINNGVTLCEKCHSLTDNYRGRGIIKKILKTHRG